MAWTPAPVDEVPSNDELLAKLAPEAGESMTGYITAADLEEVIDGLLNKLHYGIYVQATAPVDPPVNAIWFETPDDGATITGIHVAVAT